MDLSDRSYSTPQYNESSTLIAAAGEPCSCSICAYGFDELSYDRPLDSRSFDFVYLGDRLFCLLISCRYLSHK